MSARWEELVGNAILGIDTLWGGDVMCASGTGRFIADSWFGDEPLPAAYTIAEAAPVRQSGGVSASSPDVAAIDAYLSKVDIAGAIEGLKSESARMDPLRSEYVAGLALCFETMWDLAMEMLGRGPKVSYDRCVTASCAQAPEPSDPRARRERVAELLDGPADLLAAVDAWRAAHRVSMASIRLLGETVIPLDGGSTLPVVYQMHQHLFSTALKTVSRARSIYH